MRSCRLESYIVGPPLAAGLHRLACTGWPAPAGLPVGGPTLHEVLVPLVEASVYSRATPGGWPAPTGLHRLACTGWPASCGWPGPRFTQADTMLPQAAPQIADV